MREISKQWLESASLDLENTQLIISLDSLYIESRYPGEFGLLPEGKPTIKQAIIFYAFAQEVHGIVKRYLEEIK